MTPFTSLDVAFAYVITIQKNWEQETEDEMRTSGSIGSADQNIYVVTLQTMIALFSPSIIYIMKYLFKEHIHLKFFNTIHINIVLAKMWIVIRMSEKVG